MPDQSQKSGGIVLGGWADTALMAFIVVLILWILRRQGTITDKIGDKLDGFQKEIGSVKAEVVGYRESWEKRKDGLLETFNRICHERQESCAGLVDTKLEGVDKSFSHVCTKVNEIKRDRERRWSKQDEINADVIRIKNGLNRP